MANPNQQYDTQLIVQGFMIKQGGMHKNWKKRWFCNSLEDPFTLGYYTDETCKDKKGSIDLREVYHFRTKGPKQRVGLALVTPSRTWKLIATGSTNGDYWTQGLERLIHRARRMGNGSTTGGSGNSPKLTAQQPPSSASVPQTQPQQPTQTQQNTQNTQNTTAPLTASSAGNVNPTPLVAPPTLIAPVGSQRNDETSQQQPLTQQQQPPIQQSNDSKPADQSGSKTRPTATALFAYTAANSNELSFQKGDKLTVLQRDDEAGWWAAELNGKRGWVSSFYVAIDP